MTELQLILRNIQVIAFVLLALVALRLWLRHRSKPAAWVAATFGVLGSVALVGRLIPATELSTWETKVLVVILLLFPMFLYCFMASLDPPPRWMTTFATAFTAGILLWTLLLPRFPAPGEPRSPSMRFYVAGVLIHWVLLSFTVAFRLWRAGRGEPGVVRRRMDLLALASIALAVTLVLSSLTPRNASGAPPPFVQAAGIAAGLVFLLGFAPPKFLRTVWRQRESERLRDAVAHLMAATTAEQVTGILLPHATAVVGGRSAALVDAGGSVLASHGVSAEFLEDARGAGADPLERVLRTPMGRGELVIWASPYTPLFGAEEVELAKALAALAQMALERAELFAQEREFIANASHEMRTPLTAIVGLSATLSERWDHLSRERTTEILAAIERQGERARVLIANLLDLARVGRLGRLAAIEDVDVRRCVERVSEMVTPPIDSLEIDIPEGTMALADPLRLDQILTNLLTNASRYGGPNVSVAARSENGRVILEVADDGPGVDPELVPELFDPFTRGGGAGVPAGSGLGLTISRRLAESWGASLTYRPGVPRGAVFLLSMARAEVGALA